VHVYNSEAVVPGWRFFARSVEAESRTIYMCISSVSVIVISDTCNAR
jgi:hypothetical protein